MTDVGPAGVTYAGGGGGMGGGLSLVCGTFTKRSA